MTETKSSLKITVIGSQSTGKTSLSRILSEELNLPFIAEVARNFKKEQLNPSYPSYLSIQKEILRLQLQEESLYNSFVSDRSSLDNLAYYLYGCYDTASDLDNNSYISQSVNNALNYTHIFFLRPEFKIKNDEFRDTNILYQYNIDNIIKCILQLYNINYYMLSGTIENRIKKAMEILER